MPTPVTLVADTRFSPSGEIFSIEIPETVPSLNIIMRLHWTSRRKLSQRWQWNILAARPAVFKNYPLSRVHITRRSKKLLDADNLYGSAKIVVDALKTARLIVDDSPRHMELVCSQEKGKPCTEITIQAIEVVS